MNTAVLSFRARETSWASSYLAERGIELQTRVIPHPTSTFVLEHVAIVYGFDRASLLVKRDQEKVRPRQLAMYLSRELTHESLPAIARTFGKKDHTTVMYACARVRERCAHDPELREEVADLRRLIEESFGAYRRAIMAERQAS